MIRMGDTFGPCGAQGSAPRWCGPCSGRHPCTRQCPRCGFEPAPVRQGLGPTTNRAWGTAQPAVFAGPNDCGSGPLSQKNHAPLQRSGPLEGAAHRTRRPFGAGDAADARGLPQGSIPVTLMSLNVHQSQHVRRSSGRRRPGKLTRYHAIVFPNVPPCPSLFSRDLT